LISHSFLTCALAQLRALPTETPSIQQHREIHYTHRARRAQITTKTHKSPPHHTATMPAEHNTAQETNERSTELDNKAKWLDSLKYTASESMRAIYAQHTPAIKAM
jgi:hypothetical protein